MPAATPFTFYAHDAVDGDRRTYGEIPFTRFSFEEVLNGAGRFDGTLPLTHASSSYSDGFFATLEPAATTICVDYGGRLVFVGLIDTVEVRTGANEYEMRVAGPGVLDYWSRRWVRSRQGMTYSTGTAPVEVIWTSIDQFRIAKDALDHAANIAAAATIPLAGVRFNGPGAGGISGVSRSKTVYGYERKVVAQLIDELARQEFGFDYGINGEWAGSPPEPSLYFDLYYPRRGVSTAQVTLEPGGNGSLLNLTRDGKDVANPLVGVGAGSADAQITVEAEDASYRAPTGPYPYMEGSIEFRDWGVESTNNIARFARAKLAQTRAPVSTVRMTLVEAGGLGVGDFGLGDTVTVTADVRDLSYSEELRVMAQAFTVGPTGMEEWSVSLAPVDATLGLG